MRNLWQLAIFLMVAVLFFKFPEVVMPIFLRFFLGLEWVMLALMAVGVMVFIYLKITRKKPEDIGFHLTRDKDTEHGIWVGYSGENLPLSIAQKDDGLHVEWAPQNYWFVIAVTGVFAPGMLALYRYQPAKFNFDLPLPFLVFAVLLWGVAWIALFDTLRRYLFRKPELVISSVAIVYKQGGRVTRTLWKQQVKYLGVTETSYHTTHSGPIANFMLVAHLDDGQSQALCITDKEPQVRLLQEVLNQKGFG